MVCYITTYVHNYLPISPFVFPLILISFLVVYLFNPFNICLRSSRWWLIKTIWRLVAAPFYHVTFADFWLGDQLVSMSQAMKDLEFIGCFYINKFKDNFAVRLYHLYLAVLVPVAKGKVSLEIYAMLLFRRGSTLRILCLFYSYVRYNGFPSQKINIAK